MIVHFHKYHGAGNDFILLNNFTGQTHLSSEQIAFICNRHFGVGADGLIEIRRSEHYDFKMIYYNSNGLIGSMCGNGGRAATAFANQQQIVGTACAFEAYDGVHYAQIIENIDNRSVVRLSMKDIEMYDINDNRLIINTGSPHYVAICDNLAAIDIHKSGKKIRYDKSISKEGVNVNFLENTSDGLFLRTYERGVENETLSCGTGVTAAAIAANLWFGTASSVIHTKGGQLKVSLERDGTAFRNITLEGPAEFVFSGQISLR